MGIPKESVGPREGAGMVQVFSHELRRRWHGRRPAAWAVAVNQELHPGGLGAVHVFRPGWERGDPDVWLREGKLGVGPMSNVDNLRASQTELFWGTDGASCDSARWDDLLGGGPFHPTSLPDDDCQ